MIRNKQRAFDLSTWQNTLRYDANIQNCQQAPAPVADKAITLFCIDSRQHDAGDEYSVQYMQQHTHHTEIANQRR